MLSTPRPATNAVYNRVSAAASWVRALELTAPITRTPDRLLCTAINEWAEKTQEAPALVSARESMTYRMLAERSNQYTRWALHHGLAKEHTVCLIMQNRPEYIAIWLGITRTGCTVALVNTNLAGPALAHCINIADPKHIIIAAELVDNLISALPILDHKPTVWVHGADDSGFDPIGPEIENTSPEAVLGTECPRVTTDDRALLIYTSGTTGMPKAANVSHGRLMQWSLWFAGMMGTLPEDRLYSCLPMYHSVGGIVATGSVLAAGGSVAISESFSASQFWSDIARWDCTLFQYIGELCRYLLHTAQSPAETQHRIRMCCGNGLRPEIWDSFQSRFRIPRVLEFYASTEGNVSLFNVEGRPGAVGRIPYYLAHRFPAALIRLDLDQLQAVRGEDGFCVCAAPQEIGEAIGRILNDRSNPGNWFEGYTSREESEKKILRNVFEEGDAWFRTGDLMRKDEQGYFYFVDRIGDTFRWKGENVSTTEISEAICTYPGITHATVYGVPVPGAEGRAGMAMIVTSEQLELASFRDHLSRALPKYAQPLFVRKRDALEITSTFKYTKTGLMRDGYNPETADDAMYFNDHQRGAFVPLDADLYARIQKGQVRL